MNDRSCTGVLNPCFEPQKCNWSRDVQKSSLEMFIIVNKERHKGGLEPSEMYRSILDLLLR